MSRRIVVTSLAMAAAVMVVIAGQLWSWTQAEATPRPREANSATRQPGEQAAIAQLTVQVDQLRASQGATAQIVRSLRDASPPAAALEPAPEEVERRNAERIAAQTSLMQDTFDRQTPDRLWAPTAAEQLRAAYAGEAFAGVAVEADCKTDLCRIVFQFPQGTHIDHQPSMIQLKAPWSGEGFMYVDLVAPRATYYLARPERELPRIDAF